APADKPDQDQELILVRARNADVLNRLIERVNHVQKEMGQLKDVEVRERAGRKYCRRVEPTGDTFYYLNGAVLAFSSREEMIKQAIDLDRSAAVEETPAIAKQLRLLGADSSLATLWLNPRAFDNLLATASASLPGEIAQVLKTFQAYWQA